MDEEQQLGGKKKSVVDAFLAKPHLARLATADPQTGQPHVVPVWFGWDGEAVWISSYSSTRKIRELKKNAFCAVLVDVPEAEEGISAVLFEGKVELITSPRDWLEQNITWVYIKYLGEEGVLAKDPQAWIVSPENLLIKLVPERCFTW